MKFLRPITCNICGTQGGSIELDTRFGWVEGKVSDEMLSIADHRCDPCKTSYGDFAQMSRELRQLIPDGNKVEALLKENRKVDLVAKAISKEPTLKDFKGDFTIKAFQDELDKVRSKQAAIINK